MSRNNSDKNQIKRLLINQIARLPDEAPPLDFTETIMQRLQPKRISFLKRLQIRFQTPLAVISLRPLTAGAVVFVLATLLFVYQTIWLQAVSKTDHLNVANDNCSIVNFRLDLPAAEKVAVIGSFNHWQPEGYQLRRSLADGTWQLSVPIQAGQYTYAFLVDDYYVMADPSALWELDDGFGKRNSILTINKGCSDENQM
jgi:hypothetical protein